jgi:two-component system cell cycle sensor histidine kinase/response regulator CckA
VYAAHAAEVRLVLLDVTMPQLDGEGTLGELRARHGDVKVILSSGYDESTAMQRIAAQGRPAFIQKPYRFSQFAALVREVVGSTDSK